MSYTTYAQKNIDLEGFNVEVGNSLEFLRIPGDCKSVAFLIKIDVDSTSIKEIILSDGLEGPIRDLFVERLKHLDATLLLNYAKENKLPSISFLLPVYYLTNSKGCLNPMIDWDAITRFSKFKDQNFVGKCIWLKSLSMKYTIDKN